MLAAASTPVAADPTENGDPLATIHVELLSRSYTRGPNVVRALRDVSLDVQPGEFVAVMGASGSGKSTLMNLLGCLDRPSVRTYLLDGLDVSELGKDDLALVRNRKIGFVFQDYNLLPRMTARDNVMLPMLYAGAPRAVIERCADAALRAVGLGDRGDHRPAEMSCGEQQRAARSRTATTRTAC